MNMRYICKQYIIINTRINMKLRKNILVLVACIATLAMCASCDKDDNDSSANIFTHRIYLDFITPEGNNLLDANAFADYSKGYNTAQDYFCDDQLHQLRLYCQVSNSRPVITRVEYDDDPGNLLDHDPYYRIAQQIGYTQFTNNRAYFYIPIIVRRG